MRIYWRSYCGGFREALRSYGPADPAPALLGGYRHADLIMGSTVGEVKTGRMDQPEYVDALFTQLLTYILLACHDGRPINDVVVYLARYGVLIRYLGQDLLEETAGRQADAVAAGSELAAVIRASETLGGVCSPGAGGRPAAAA
ncbi:hypothetical protein AB0H57_11035 [Micromonospora sp. NPDC050686]|uniref:hypothetical protein n=1 Tax=Micromonospora sp. NPDC050686 TaxID=3154631 RepID=UPI0033CCCCEA